MSSANEKPIKIRDDVRPTFTIDLGPPRFCKVKVLSSAGIFKNGKQYNKGRVAIIALVSAQGLEANGDVEIIEEVKAPKK